MLKIVSNQKNLPDEFAHNVSKKSPSDELFVRKFRNLHVFFSDLHDSNSNFRPAGINSELVSDRTTVHIFHFLLTIS